MVIHFSILAPLTACGLFVAAAVSDLKAFRIPNTVVVGILAVFAAGALLGPLEAGLEGLAAGLVVFICGIVVFRCGWCGAGDVKLLAVAALWSGFAGLAALMMATAVAGTVLSLALMTPLRRLLPAGPDLGVGLLRRPVPYGVAICAGAMAVLVPKVWG
jgi:prepilin peptidase CpaA